MNRNRKTKEILICALVVTGVLSSAGRDAKGDFVFGTPTNLGPAVNSLLHEAVPRTSADGLSIVFWRGATFDDPGEMWMFTQTSKHTPWGSPVNFGPWTDSHPNIIPIDNILSLMTADGLETYLGDIRPGGYGGLDLLIRKRETIDDDWGPPVNLGPVVNSTHDDRWPSISSDGLELYFDASNRPGGYGGWDLWVTKRATRDAPWTEPVNLGSTINSGVLDARPCLSADGLLLFFDSKRPGGYGSCDLYMTKRTSRSDPWQEAVNLGPIVNSSDYDEVAYISGDGSTLYFDSDRPGGYGGFDIWKVSVEPVVDLNADGIVDAEDVRIIVDNWGTDEPLCDIGPAPFGDGIVDAQDMLALTEHLTKVDIEADIAAIEEVVNQYAVAVSTGDLDLFISIHTDDAVNMAPDTPATFGKEELRASLESLFDNFTLEMILYPEEAQADGNLGFARGKYTLSITPNKGGEPSFTDGKYLTICKRQDDGSWKISRECYNSNVPPAQE